MTGNIVIMLRPNIYVNVFFYIFLTGFISNLKHKKSNICVLFFLQDELFTTIESYISTVTNIYVDNNKSEYHSFFSIDILIEYFVYPLLKCLT